jgi:hypothetical protein
MDFEIDQAARDRLTSYVDMIGDVLGTSRALRSMKTSPTTRRSSAKPIGSRSASSS